MGSTGTRILTATSALLMLLVMASCTPTTVETAVATAPTSLPPVIELPATESPDVELPTTGAVAPASIGISSDGEAGSVVTGTNGRFEGFTLAWDDAGTHLLLSLPGGACSHTDVQSINRTGPQKVAILTELVGYPDATPCISIGVERTTELTLPPGIASEQPLQVLLFGQSLVLPAQT